MSVLAEAAATGSYARLYRPLVERICEEEAPKYKTDRDRVKAVKNTLHLLYGAYTYQTTPKKINALLDILCDAQAPAAQSADASAALLSLHASTRERLPHLAAFYAFIHAVVNEPQGISSVLDVGCGYSPFALPWMPWRGGLTAYYALDIDTQTSALLNRYFAALGLPQAAGNADLAVETPHERVDLALLCKLLPVLEAQNRGRGYGLLDALAARYAVVTFPLKSLSGREKGMRAHYKGPFEEHLKQPGAVYAVMDSAEIGNELVYVLRRTC